MTDTKKLLKTLWFTPGREGRWGLPMLFWGAPGTAKTSVLKNMGRQVGFSHVEILSPGERGEGAFGVIPVPSRDGNRITYPAPEWTDKFDGDARGLVFVDEINRAAEALQPPLLGLVNELRIGGHYLGKNVRICAAANPAETAPGVYELDPAQANRMGHMPWPAPSVADWTAWALSGADDMDGEVLSAEGEENRVMAVWPTEFAKAIGTTTAFLRSFPSLHHAQPAVGDPQCTRAWPSPRTWELAMRAWAGAAIHMAGDQAGAETLLEAFVGPGAASQFVSWRALIDLPDPIAILDGAEEFKHDKKKLDRTMATLASCAAMVCPGNSVKRQERSEILWKILNFLSDKTADLVEPTARSLVRAKLQGSECSKSVMRKLHPLLRLSGDQTTQTP